MPGLPNAFGGYDETPRGNGGVLAEFAANGWLNLVGGCCGLNAAATSRQSRRRCGPPPPAGAHP